MTDARSEAVHSSTRGPFLTSLLVLSLIAGLSAPAARAQAGRAVVDADDPGIGMIARRLGPSGLLRLTGLDLDLLGPRDLELERFSVFSDDAEIRVDGNPSGRVPDNAYFRGVVEGMPGSLVVLSAREKGQIRGYVVAREGYWVLSGRAGAPGLATRKFDLDEELAGRTFDCQTDSLSGAFGVADDAFGTAPETAVGPSTASSSAFSHSARVAVETDWEFFNLFGNVTDATDYVGDLFAFSSSIYQGEVATSLEVSHLSLYSQNNDPWTQSGCNAALDELQSYWNTNNGSIDRAVVHMLSGKSTGCGIAYVGVLCNEPWAYGVSGSLSGAFDIDNPTSMWDIIVVSHEIGHNFNSPHTHCYGGVEGQSSPVDACYSGQCGGSGCWCGSQSLPCTGGAGAGDGCGTIMSYCHLLAGSYGNITLTFGGVHDGSVVHPHGVAGDRVPRRMYNHASTRGSCMDPVSTGPTLSVTKTGTGSGTVTSNDGGIDCGADCSQTYAAGTNPVVVLTATADAGSGFVGWSNDPDCVDGSVTVDANMTCTAEFETTCGNGIVDSGEECDGSNLNGAVCAGDCLGPPTCTAGCQLDYSSCTNGICEAGETCGGCAADCTGEGAACGNGVCEAGAGESCLTCPADCAGTTTGKPSNRFCCGFADGYGPDGCGDSRCGGSAACIESTASTCCGDAICSSGEDPVSCARDCTGTCSDSDADGWTDCAGDCNDGDPDVHPGHNDTKGRWGKDGIDNDCNGMVDG
jgi:hypothetical protein